MQKKPFDADAYYDTELMTQCYEQMKKDTKIISISNNRLLHAIKSVKGNAFHRNLKNFLKDLEESCMHEEWIRYEIVRNTTGKFQNEKWGREIKGYWCDQWASGIDGDSWNGYIYIELKPNRFLKVNYEM